MTRKLNLVLLALLVFVGAPFWWLLLDGSTRQHAAKPIAIEELRRLAAARPGEAPTEVRYEVIGRRRVISDLLAAGSGLRPMPFVIRAYQLVRKDGSVIAVDRGMSRIVARQHRVRDFDPLAQAAVEHAVATASLALTLAPDVQHSGRTGTPPALGSGLAAAQNAAGGAPYPVAPGVVVVPAYGVGPGKRMLYVRLADGRELLFTGDVAPIHASWQEQRPPARLITTFFVGDDREEIAAWLRTIDAMVTTVPGLQIVTGHSAIVPRMLIHGFAGRPGGKVAGAR